MSQSERVRTRIQALDERLTRLRVAKSRLVARASQTEAGRGYAARREGLGAVARPW
jgi:hypothetical protein